MFSTFLFCSVFGVSLIFGQTCTTGILECVDNFDPCTLPDTGLLGGVTYEGKPTYLYGGSNNMPSGHRTAGQTIGDAIVKINGKIVILGIGMSNTKLELDVLKSDYVDTTQVRTDTELVNGAAGGWDACRQAITEPDTYWTNVHRKVTKDGFTDNQIQIGFVKVTNNKQQQQDGTPANGGNECFTDAGDKDFPSHASVTEGHMYEILKRMKTEFTNLKMVYISSTTYAGWSCDGGATFPGYRSPVAFEEGFSVKFLISKQISGQTGYEYDGQNPTLPWLSWGPYFWDKYMPQDWFQADGAHPDDELKDWVAEEWHDFLIADTTSDSWWKP